MTETEVHLRPTSIRDDRLILETARLRPGFNRTDLSRYGDMAWDLRPAVFRENVKPHLLLLKFSSIKDPTIVCALREYLYVRLNIDAPASRYRLQPSDARGAFNFARRFFSFVASELGSFELAQVDQDLIDRYAKMIKERGVHPRSVANALEVIFDLHIFREHFTSATLKFEPWPGRSSSVVAGIRYQWKENQTPRIPENIISPLLMWALRYIETFAPDIFAAREELARLEVHRDILKKRDAVLTGRDRRRAQLERLESFLNGLRAAGRGVPVWPAQYVKAGRGTCIDDVTSPFNWRLLHLHVGIEREDCVRDAVDFSQNALPLLIEASAELGTEEGGADTTISAIPGTRSPWRPRFDTKSIAHEEHMLQAACYVACAYLTGMRDSEVQAMRSGCLSIARSEDGIIERYRIRSTIYKARSAAGEAAEWVTIAPVAKAVEVLERLSLQAVRARGVDTLWPVLSLTMGRNVHVSAKINFYLNSFRDHLNKLFGTETEPAVPPGPAGTQWSITTRQFRRTMAANIANRPFGTIAGMIQYKHATIAAFEGYAGTSRSGFRAEVESERQLGQSEDILVYFDERQAGVPISGPAGSRISRALDAVANDHEPPSVMIADRGRVRAMLGHLARTLHIGVLADCFFDPSTALCLKSTNGTSHKGPMTAMCQPTRCPNACITKRHEPVWSKAALEAKAMLKEKRLSDVQRLVLRQDLDRFQGVLKGIGVSTKDGAL